MATRRRKTTAFRRRRNPSSEEDWAVEQGLEYGMAVAQNVNFDRDAAYRYVRDNWKDDLGDELKQAIKIADKSQVTSSPISVRQLGDAIKRGTQTGILTAIASHEDDLARAEAREEEKRARAEEAEAARRAEKANIPRKEYDAGYAQVIRSEYVRPQAPKSSRPAPPRQEMPRPTQPSPTVMRGGKESVSSQSKPFVKRAAQKTAGVLKKSAAWLHEYSLRPNPPHEMPLWAERIRRRGLPEDEVELVAFLIESGVSKWKIIRALADTCDEVFAALFPRVPNPDVLMDTLELIRFAQDDKPSNTNHDILLGSIQARMAFHERRSSGYPCEQAVRFLLNMSFTAATSTDRVLILSPTISLIHALEACLFNSELDSRSFVWHTLTRALIANR